MKINRFILALFLIIAGLARAANTTIEAIATTSVLPAVNDYIPTSGVTYGTRKMAGASFTYLTATRTSLAALSITGAADGAGVLVLGATAAGDGGGASYFWSATSTATPNGNTVILPASAPGTGRWLKATGNVGFPGPSTIGGIFSNAGVSHKWVSAINTDGTVTLTQPDAADLTGLGTMAVQNANAVAITGGTIDGTPIGGTTPAAGTFSAGTVTSSNVGSTALNLINLSSGGRSFQFYATGSGASTPGQLGLADSTSSTTLFTVSPSTHRFTMSGIDGTPIGVSSASSGVFNVLTRSGTSSVNSVWGIVSDSTNYNMITFNNVATAAGLLGIQGGASGDSNLYIKAPTGGVIEFRVNNTAVADITSTGLNSTTIGATTPAAAIFTTVASNSNANIQTTKGNFNVSLNVRDFGAKGDGSTNDTTAVTNARTAAIAAHGVIYFPGSTGAYMVDSSALTFSSASNVAIRGDGPGASIVKCRSPGQVLHVSGDHISVSGLTFDGSCTTRTAGQQAVVFDCSNSTFQDNEIINSGEYAFFAGSGSTQIVNLNVHGNIVRACYADGINFQYVANSSITDNIINGSDDDCIALGYNGSGACSGIVVSGNYCHARNDLGTNWGRGILAERVNDCQIIGNYIDGIKQTGILLNGASGAAVWRVSVIGNFVNNACINSGNGIAAYVTDDCVLQDNYVVNPYSGNLIEIADWGNLTISGGVLTQERNAFARGIHVDEGGGWVNSTWYNLVIKGVTIRLEGASTNSGIYLAPTSSYTMTNGAIVDVVGKQFIGGDYISVAAARQGGTWKIGNNVTLSGNSVTAGGTLFNNN